MSEFVDPSWERDFRPSRCGCHWILPKGAIALCDYHVAQLEKIDQEKKDKKIATAADPAGKGNK